MKKRLGLAIATLGTAMALLTPATAMARDRDDWGRGDRHDRHEWRERERHERHEAHERWEHRYRRGYYGGNAYGYYGNGGYYSNPGYYGDGYYQQAPPQGYYDRWGYFHPY